MRFGKKKKKYNYWRDLFNGWETESEMGRDGKRNQLLVTIWLSLFLLIYNLSLLNVKFIDKNRKKKFII